MRILYVSGHDIMRSSTEPPIDFTSSFAPSNGASSPSSLVDAEVPVQVDLQVSADAVHHHIVVVMAARAHAS